MQHRSPWRIVWSSLVGHLLIAAVLLKALPPAAVGATGTHDAVDVVMVVMVAPREGRAIDPGDSPQNPPVPLFQRGNVQSIRQPQSPPFEKGGQGDFVVGEGARHLLVRARPSRDPASATTTETPVAGDALRSSPTGRTGHSATLARIRARLNRAKRYPAEARRQQLSGHPVVEFTIRRNGTTTAARIITSSGITILDTAALHTIRRAEPLPYLSDPIQVPIGFEIQP